MTNLLSEMWRLSRAAHHQRRSYVSYQWRFFILCLVLVIFSYAFWYAQQTYGVMGFVSEIPNKAPFLLSDRLVEWFAYGFFVGFLVFALLQEGELLLGLRRVAKEFAAQAGSAVRTAQNVERAAEKALRGKADRKHRR